MNNLMAQVYQKSHCSKQGWHSDDLEPRHSENMSAEMCHLSIVERVSRYIS